MEALITSFSIVENLPFIIFNLVFFVIFIFFLFGSFILVFGGEESQRIERGQKVILNSLYGLFVLLLVALVFFLGTFLLKRGEVLKPPPASQEFPSAPVSITPSPPEFIKITDFYFGGPWPLKELEKKKVFENTEIKGLYAILCKKNGDYNPSSLVESDGYDIIYVGGTGGEQEKQSNYQCWSENCANKTENLYMAILQMSAKKFSRSEIDELTKKIRSKINLPCPANNL